MDKCTLGVLGGNQTCWAIIPQTPGLIPFPVASVSWCLDSKHPRNVKKVVFRLIIVGLSRGQEETILYGAMNLALAVLESNASRRLPDPMGNMDTLPHIARTPSPIAPLIHAALPLTYGYNAFQQGRKTRQSSSMNSQTV